MNVPGEFSRVHTTCEKRVITRTVSLERTTYGVFVLYLPVYDIHDTNSGRKCGAHACASSECGAC